MKKELHLIIIWEKGRYKQDEIIKDISSNFSIRNIFEIDWDCSKEEWKKNLQRFYGVKLEDINSKVENETGYGKFLAIIFYDNNPKYSVRNTSRGKKRVNINVFDKKEEYRILTGCGTKIHSTNSITETNHDLTLLFGKNCKDFVNTYAENTKLCLYDKQPFGNGGFKSFEDVFYLLNNCDEYCVLRNYEDIKNGLVNCKHGDIDLISNDSTNTALLLNGINNFDEFYRVSYSVMINSKSYDFDLRDINDGYYCKKLSKDILKKKTLFDGFYAVTGEMHFYTLMYHMLFHKKNISADYISKLNKISNHKLPENINKIYLINIMNKWLKKNEYTITIPSDMSVLFNYKNADIAYDSNLEMLDLHYKETLKERNYYLKAYNEISNSKIWKITAPFRLFLDRIKELL